MPGINRTGLSQPQDYNLGRGKVFFALQTEVDASNNYGSGSGPFRDVGNATEFNLTVETETLEHQSSLSGLKTVDKEVKLSQKVSMSITLDEINFQNLALFLSGESVDLASVGPQPGTGNLVYAGSDAVGNTDVVAVITNPLKARWFELRETEGAYSGPLPGVDLMFDFDSIKNYGVGSNEDQVLVELSTDSGGTYPTTLVEGTHYNLDRILGRIFFIYGDATIPNAGTTRVRVTVRPTKTAQKIPIANYQAVKALTEGEISGVLMFVAANPAGDDHQTSYIFHKVNLKAEGDFSLIGDEFTTMQLNGAAEAGPNATDTDPRIVTVRTHTGTSQPSA